MGDITELESLIRGHHIGNNSADNSEISGSLSGGIAETFPYGKAKKSDIDFKIEKVNNAIIELPNQVKNGGNWAEKQYKEKKEEIIEN